MIGVLCGKSEEATVQEFFQLFKTPWEPYVPGRSYDVVISSGLEIPENISAGLLLIYQSRATAVDERFGVRILSRAETAWAKWRGGEIPLYGAASRIDASGQPFLSCRKGNKLLGCMLTGETLPVVRIGFDLFSEVEFLLRVGQPIANAHVPALDLHIQLLRTIIVSLGCPLAEILPVPADCDFVSCLTHDVDFVGIRSHKCDHTMWGFLYRCFVVSPLNALQGRLPWSKVLYNFRAALSLPFVYAGFMDDFWLEFDRYMALERDLGSTFFFIPFRGVPGKIGAGSAPSGRSAKYEFGELSEQVRGLLENGCEVGVHGIDGWHDSRNAVAELRRIQEMTGEPEMGVRMHWLYWAEKSAKTLEDAGFAYDSTFGYNDAVGFRAGTTQPFRPLGAEHLLELSLNIQDSAMLYPNRMGLTEAEALDACDGLIHVMLSNGGALTLNWHTRSLSPERLWGDLYRELLRRIRSHRVWFSTARETVRWFKKRRMLRFESVRHQQDYAAIRIAGLPAASNPAFTIRLYHPRAGSPESKDLSYPLTYTDHRWDGEATLDLPLLRSE